MDGAFGPQTAEGVGAAVKPQKKELGKWRNFLSRGYVCRFKHLYDVSLPRHSDKQVSTVLLGGHWKRIM